MAEHNKNKPTMGDKFKHVMRETWNGTTDGAKSTMWNAAVIGGLAAGAALTFSPMFLVGIPLLVGSGALALGTGVFKSIFEGIKGIGTSFTDPLNGASGLIKAVVGLGAATVAGISVVTGGSIGAALLIGMGIPAVVSGALGLVKGLFTMEKGGEKIVAEKQLAETRAQNAVLREQAKAQILEQGQKALAQQQSAAIHPPVMQPGMGLPPQKGPGMQMG